MRFLVPFVSVLSVVTQQVLAVTPQQIASDLSKSLSSGSEVLLTSNASYSTKFTQRWTIYAPSNPTYAVAVKPATVQDLQKVVKYAVNNNVSMLATGGGHGYTTTLSSVNNGLNVDLSKFKNVKIDASSNTAVIGAASIFADIYDPLYAAGKQLTTGGSSSPSVIGVTLGGGIGPLSGAHGLIIDSLLSVEMVTGSGEIVTASATQNTDLFWGMRGAGVNFGIVTSATYRIYDTLNNGMVYNADLVFPAEKNGTLFKILKTYQGTQDDKLALTMRAAIGSDGAPAVDVSAIYFGTQDQGNNAIKSFLDQQPTYKNISYVPYNKLVYTANFGGDVFAAQKGVKDDLWGYQLNNLDVPTLITTYNSIIDFFLANPSVAPSSFWVLEKFGLGVTANISDDSTAYPWRQSVSYGFFAFNLPSDASSQLISTIDTFAKGLRSGLSSGCGNPSGNVFMNYARGNEKPEQIYGTNKLGRLRQIKSKYDPSNLFSHYNSFT